MSFLHASLYFHMHLISPSIQAVQGHTSFQICLFTYVPFLAMFQ